jgi:hypothetical protein
MVCIGGGCASGVSVSGSMWCDSIGEDGFGVVVHSVTRVDSGVHQNPQS